MTPQHRSARSAGAGPFALTGTGTSPARAMARERLADHTVVALGDELDIASAPSPRERPSVTRVRTIGSDARSAAA